MSLAKAWAIMTPFNLFRILTLSAFLANSITHAGELTRTGIAPTQMTDALKTVALPGHFLVTLQDNADPRSFAREYDIQLDHVYTNALNGFAARLDSATRQAIEGDPRVLKVDADQRVFKLSPENLETQAGATWGIDRIDQRILPINSTYNFLSRGAGVTAYIIDTGIRLDHAEFEGRARLGFDALGGDGADCHGHGTHVAGTVGGKTWGVAKDVDLVAVRVIDCTGGGTIAGLIAGIDWVVQNRQLPAVANMSLGTLSNSTLDAAVQRLINSGVTTAVAAGNDGISACNFSPARVAAAITVSATGRTDIRPSWSNTGTCVDWFAPGEAITSAWFTSASATEILSGTSMATSHTAGVAALYLSAHPTSTPAQVRAALFDFTTKGAVLGTTTNNHLLHSLENPTSTDLTNPTVVITSPFNNARVIRKTNVAITAVASDNVAVVKVAFYVNGTLKCTDNVAPYSCTWATPNSIGFRYQLTARAYDSAGRSTLSPIVNVFTRSAL